MYVPYLMIMGHWRIDLKPVFIMFLSSPITWGIQNSKTGTNFRALKSRKTSEFPRGFPSEFFRNSYRYHAFLNVIPTQKLENTIGALWVLRLFQFEFRSEKEDSKEFRLNACRKSWWLQLLWNIMCRHRDFHRIISDIVIRD